MIVKSGSNIILNGGIKVTSTEDILIEVISNSNGYYKVFPKRTILIGEKDKEYQKYGDPFEVKVESLITIQSGKEKRSLEYGDYVDTLNPYIKNGRKCVIDGLERLGFKFWDDGKNGFYFNGEEVIPFWIINPQGLKKEFTKLTIEEFLSRCEVFKNSRDKIIS